MASRTAASLTEFIATKEIDPRRPIVTTALDQIASDQLYCHLSRKLVLVDVGLKATLSSASFRYVAALGKTSVNHVNTYNARAAIRIRTDSALASMSVTLQSDSVGPITLYSGVPGVNPVWVHPATLLSSVPIDDGFTLNLAYTGGGGAAAAIVLGLMIYAVVP